MKDENQEEVVEQPGGQDTTPQLDSIASEILADEGSQDSPETKDEQPIGQDVKEPEVEQPTDETYEITEEEFNTLTKDYGYTEDDLDNLNREKIDEILENETKKQSESQAPVFDENAIVTESMAAKFGGAAKIFIGQPVSELFKSIENANKTVQKLSVENKQFKSKLNQGKIKEADDLIKILKNPKNELTEEEYFQLIDKYGTLMKEAGLEEAKLEPSENEKETEGYNRLQAVLDGQFPDLKLNSRETLVNWWGSIDKQQQEIFQNSPDIVIQGAVLNYVKSEQAKLKEESTQAEIQRLKDENAKIQAKIEQKAKKLAANKVRTAISESKGKVDSSKFKITPRVKESTNRGLDPVAMEILDEANAQ